jgi:hypothetical protein
VVRKFRAVTVPATASRLETKRARSGNLQALGTRDTVVFKESTSGSLQTFIPHRF